MAARLSREHPSAMNGRSMASVAWSKDASILWFPVFFAIALPLCFLIGLHRPLPHNEQIAFVGSAKQEGAVTGALHHLQTGGFDVRQFPSAAAAIAAVRDRRDAAAYVDGSVPTVYLARAASATRASYLQNAFAAVAKTSRTPAPVIDDLVPLRSGDGGTGIFF